MFAITTLMVAAGHAHAADIDPVGVGDLMPSPASKVGKDEGTLYETYQNPNLWQLDSDFGKWDILDPMAESIADICMALIAVLGTACVVVVTWIFQLVSIPALQNAITKSIGGAASGLISTLLPSALAVGALVAFAQHKKGGGGGGLSQLTWVFVSGVVSVSLLTSPGTWVGGVESARQIGANVAMDATSKGLGDGTGDFPFKLDHKPKFTGETRDDMLRKASNAVWTSYVATPWCVANFGSFEVCEKYGKDLLNRGTSKGNRKEWLQDNVNDEAVGSDSVKWRQGHSPVGRIMVTLPCLVAIIVFAALVLMLAFTSLASLIGALMLLVAGVIFACMWVIPGRPRTWGLGWFDQLLGRTLESTIAMMTLGSVLTVNTACTTLFDQYGYLPATGISIAGAVVGFKFRAIVAQIFGVSGTSTVGGQMMGLLAARSLSKLGRRGDRRRGGSDHTPQPVRTRGGRGGGRGGAGSGGGGRGGGGLPAIPGGPGSADDFEMTITRPPMRPPAPAPLPGPDRPGGADRPGLPAGTTPTRPSAPTVTLDRDDRNSPTGKARATVPPPPTRPTLPEGETSARPDAVRLTRTSSSERPDTMTHYQFRQAPPLAPPRPDGNPRVIQGTVVRSSTTPPPKRVPGRPLPPPRAIAPARRTGQPAPKHTNPSGQNEG
ncbi:hypothetical protein [Streptomyces antimycoticus]|uniref:hypothetical protein n=1 Tax=Streptomyces antimycoticus TaxID=68175 RepID=UPI0036F019ED